MIGGIYISYLDVKRRIRRRKIRFRIFLSVILISVVIVYLLKTPVFKVTSIEVKDNTIVDKNTIIELSGISIGENLLRLDTSKISKNVMTNSYIESCRISRNISGQVDVSVIERRSTGIISFGEKFVTMDRKGYAIEVLDKKESISLPLITGIDIKSAVPGSEIEIQDNRKLDTINAIFDNTKGSGLFDIIREIDIKNLQSIIIKTKDDINIKIGNIENISYKLKVSKVIMEEDVKKRGLKGTIDVSFNGNPVFRQEQ